MRETLEQFNERMRREILQQVTPEELLEGLTAERDELARLLDLQPPADPE